MVFVGVILHMKPESRKSHEIRRRITRRLYLWEIGQYATLCAYTIAEIRSRPKRTIQYNEDTYSSIFNSKVNNGKI